MCPTKTPPYPWLAKVLDLPVANCNGVVPPTPSAKTLACLSCITKLPWVTPSIVAPPGSTSTLSVYPITEEVASLFWSNKINALLLPGPAPPTSEAMCKIEEE